MDEDHTQLQSLLLPNDKMEEDKTFLHLQASELVRRKDTHLWRHHLSVENVQREQLATKVINEIIPNTQDGEQISATIDAFMLATDMVKHLLQLLEALVFRGKDPRLHHHSNIQNLLLVTAIKSCPERVMRYVTELRNFDAAVIADESIKAKLYEEALAVYNNFNMDVQAVHVLCHRIDDLPRAYQLAAKQSNPEVWTALGMAQLSRGLIQEAVDSFIEAKDYNALKEASKKILHRGTLSEKVKEFLFRSRKTVDCSCIDETIIMLLANTVAYDELKEFVSQPHNADMDVVVKHLGDENNTEALAYCRDMKPTIEVKSDDDDDTVEMKSAISAIIEVISEDEETVEICKEVIVIDDDDDDEDATYPDTTEKDSSVVVAATGTSCSGENKQNGDAMNRMRDVVECKICLSPLHNPKTLKCHHTFCKGCLEDLLQWKGGKGSAFIKCPLRCKDETKLSYKETLDDLVSSYEMKAIIETLQETTSEKEEENNWTRKCSSASCDGQVEMYCCGALMCQRCVETHKKTCPCKNGGKKVEIDRNDERLLVVCKTHNSLCKHLCATCQLTDTEGDNHFICIYCRKRNHKTHKHEEITEKATVLRDELRISLEKTRKIYQLKQMAAVEISKHRETLNILLESQKTRWMNDPIGDLVPLASLRQEESKIKSDYEKATQIHLAQYIHLGDSSFFEKKLKITEETILLLHHKMIDVMLLKDEIPIWSAVVSLQKGQKTFECLGRLHVDTFDQRMSELHTVPFQWGGWFGEQ